MIITETLMICDTHKTVGKVVRICVSVLFQRSEQLPFLSAIAIYRERVVFLTRTFTSPVVTFNYFIPLYNITQVFRF